MFPRALLLLGLSCAALCSAQQLQETTTKAVKITTTLSEVEILLTATVCSAVAVLLVLIPTIVYDRCFKKDLGDELL